MVLLVLKSSEGDPGMVLECSLKTSLYAMERLVAQLLRKRKRCFELLRAVETYAGSDACTHDSMQSPESTDSLLNQLLPDIERIHSVLSERVAPITVAGLDDAYMQICSLVTDLGFAIPESPDHDSTKTRLWWCRKELVSSNSHRFLHDYLGTNEKSKIIIWVRGSDEGPPPRTGISVDEETHKNMLAHYYKRKEELRRLEEDDETCRDRDHCFNSEWSNPKKLKDSLIGNDGNIAYKYSL